MTGTPPTLPFWSLTINTAKQAIYLYFEPLIRLRIWLFGSRQIASPGIVSSQVDSVEQNDRQQVELNMPRAEAVASIKANELPEKPMYNQYQHPAVEVLELFVLNQCSTEEQENIETHILACELCVSRFKTLKAQVANIRLAYDEVRRERSIWSAPKQHRVWTRWFTVPNLAAAAIVVATWAIIPQLSRHPASDAEVDVVADREEPIAAPKNRDLHVTLDAIDLRPGLVRVQIVDAAGSQIWAGNATVQDEKVKVNFPKLRKTGVFFIRVYDVRPSNGAELMREFALLIR